MKLNYSRIAVVAGVALALNLIAGTAFASGDEPQKCPDEPVPCTVHSNCLGIAGYSQCVICNPFPFGQTCTYWN